jgi:hypothetical protein
MGRGGYRQGAGRKAEWRQGQTQIIRVPIALKEQLLKIGRQLDRGEDIYSPTYSALKTLIDEWQEMCEAYPPDAPQWQKVRQLIGEIQNLLASELERDDGLNQLEGQSEHEELVRLGKSNRRRRVRGWEQ